MTRIKICGITQRDDALTAIACGAHALGFIFYPQSPRALTLEKFSGIVHNLPPFITKVGLFVDPLPETVEQALQTNQLDLLQFHGNENEDFCRRFNFPYIKAIRVKSMASLSAQLTEFPSAIALLLDTFVEGVAGGAGRTFDWSLCPRSSEKPLILAGGLTPDNVAYAIQQVRPYAVDVSSGVEKTKGVKDSALIAKFTSEVFQCN